MITIPLYIFLFLYLAFLASFVIFMFVNLYHIIASGSLTFGSFVITFFLLALSAVVLYETWGLLQGVNWQATMLVFSSRWFGDGF